MPTRGPKFALLNSRMVRGRPSVPAFTGLFSAGTKAPHASFTSHDGAWYS